jgi:serine O-acetyltransferase
LSSFASDIGADLRRRTEFMGGGPARQLIEVGFWAVVLFRVARRLRQSPLRPLGRVVYNLNIMLTGADINPDFPCGPGLFIPHPVGVTIGATLGPNTTLFASCSIGGAGRSDGVEGLPVLEADCIIGTGARVLGPIVLGRGTRVGANAVVLKSTPPNSIAVGVPARVLRPETRTSDAHLDKVAQ